MTKKEKTQQIIRAKAIQKGKHTRMSRQAQRRDSESFRNKVSFSWCRKEDAIETVENIMGCSPDTARKRFESAARCSSRDKILVHDKDTGLWATADMANDPLPFIVRQRTEKQQRHWDNWSRVPDLANGLDTENSELFKWAVESGIFPDIKTAHDEYHRARSSSITDDIIPFCTIREPDGRKVIHGKNYYRPGTIRNLGQASCDRMAEAVRDNYHKRLGVQPSKLRGFEPDAIIRQALWLGDLVMVNVRKDPFEVNIEDVIGVCDLIGADTYTRQEKEKAEELVRIAAERAMVGQMEERMKARTADLDARALAASEAGVEGFDRFWNKVGDYALENGIAFEAVHRLYRMHLFQNSIEIDRAFPSKNGIDFYGIARVFKGADGFGKNRDQDCIDFMVECGLLVQTTEYDEVYKCDRIAYHGSALTFEEARQLRNELKLARPKG